MKTYWQQLVITVMLGAGSAFPGFVLAQQRCENGIREQGLITDPTGAVIAGAQVTAGDRQRVMTDATGHFMFPCVPVALARITVHADGFAPGTARAGKIAAGVASINLQLEIAHVETDVQVGENATATDADHGAGTRMLTRHDVQQLADDPDDFQRELQALAASGGGVSGAATIVVDGFQNPSALPPKGSIASIRIDPDLFSAEYEDPPYDGARIEIFTKPGADEFHGALFLTDSDSSFNANDPFSVTGTPGGKRRYGFELSGPVIPKRSGFALGLEKRDIDEFNVVNAVILNAEDTQVPFQQTVPAPQRLWIASARNDWQLSKKDIATVSFEANVNNLSNQGIGGLTLAEAGYSSLISEYDMRFSNLLTLNPNLLQETRIGYSWKRAEQTPLTTTPSIEVAGYFTGGGATSQNLNGRERDLEVDDDLSVTRGKHDLKFGVQSLGIFMHEYDPNTFNGAYVFGGGSAPELDANDNPTGQTTSVSGIEQYRRALLNLPGGTPTTYQLTTGYPLVPFTQWRLALFAQDSVKVAPHLTIAGGFRYQIQTVPSSFANYAPRVGISWAPDKKEAWVFHLRTGVFHQPDLPVYATDVYRLNGTRQQEKTVYLPSYSDPLSPTPGAIQVSTLERFSPNFHLMSSFQAQFHIEHSFKGGWHAAATYYITSDWGRLRTRNINAPIVSSSIGTPPDLTTALLAPRPIMPNENILQYENSGHLDGGVLVAGGGRSNGKRFDFSVDWVHLNVKTDTASTPTITSPQSSYSQAGESSRANWQGANQVYGGCDFHLPFKVELSSQLDSISGQRYNITTGTDANGDGNFNDRASFASAPGPGVYSTRYGLLTTNTVNGDLPRNFGAMTATLHVDANLSRDIILNPKGKEHLRTLTFNARSANLVNHTNVTAVNTILSSGTLGQPLTAETARRVELGVRFSF
jgi:hypothetical protein